MKPQRCFLFAIVALIIMATVPQTFSAVSEDSVRDVLKTLNNQLAVSGANVQIAKVEFSTYNQVGITVFANDRTHQLDSHWVPNDPRRFGDRNISYLVDHVDQTADVSWTDAVPAIDRAMNIWNTVPCASIPITQSEDYGMDWGFIQLLVGMGGFPGWNADITHAGWLPGDFFDAIGGPGASEYILGVTFTFIWVDGDPPEPTDIDNNRKDDVAFREIYYNDAFNWGIDIREFDIETIAAHEVGHGLSLGHFGKIFINKANGKLRFAPRALMNAIYYDILHELLGTDNASFCSVWSSWPNH